MGNPLCSGSGRPTRTDGGCDRCLAGDVRGEYVRLSPSAADLFSAFPSPGYYVAKPHVVNAGRLGEAMGGGDGG